MHELVLSDQQKHLFPLLKKFAGSFGLVGGTAIALQLAHRRSLDFDLFSNQPFDHLEIRSCISATNSIEQTLIDSKHELTVLVAGVKLTFYTYPYPLHFDVPFQELLRMPTLETLAAMKVFALGRRAKWKDYVDLYFLLKKLGWLTIVNATQALYGAEFNEKLFRSQLCYFEDIDYSENVDYLLPSPPSDAEVKQYLQQQAVEK